jgi:hypothetical protein
MKTTLWMGMLAGLGMIAAEPARVQAGERVHLGIVVRAGLPGEWAYSGSQRDESYRYGYERGLREGRHEGRRDAYRGNRFEYRDERNFRDSDDGWERWMGPRPAYRAGFREGFSSGYRAGYRAAFDRRGRGYGRDHDRRDDRRDDRRYDDD